MWPLPRVAVTKFRYLGRFLSFVASSFGVSLGKKEAAN